MLSCSFCGLTKFRIFGEPNAICGRQYSIKSNFLCVSNRLQIVRRQGRLAAREKNDDLTLRFERDCTIENRLGVCESWFVNVANLVSVHETRIAHHVAAIGE